MSVSIEIYVASLSDYSAGILHGRWVDCTQGVGHVEEEIQDMLAESPHAEKYGEPAEEWEIHDTDGFSDINTDRYSLDDLCRIADILHRRGVAYAAFVNNTDTISEDTFEDAFQGFYKDEEDYAYTLINDCYTLADPLAQYFDYEAFARDLFMSDYWGESTQEGFAVFANY